MIETWPEFLAAWGATFSCRRLQIQRCRNRIPPVPTQRGDLRVCAALARVQLLQPALLGSSSGIRTEGQKSLCLHRLYLCCPHLCSLAVPAPQGSYLSLKRHPSAHLGPPPVSFISKWTPQTPSRPCSPSPARLWSACSAGSKVTRRRSGQKRPWTHWWRSWRRRRGRWRSWRGHSAAPGSPVSNMVSNGVTT